MSNPVLTATHIKDGVWRFECPLHDPLPFEAQGISSPRHAPSVMKRHMDKEHPGVSVQLKVTSDYSGTSTSHYTSPVNVNTAGDIL